MTIIIPCTGNIQYWSMMMQLLLCDRWTCAVSINCASLLSTSDEMLEHRYKPTHRGLGVGTVACDCFIIEEMSNDMVWRWWLLVTCGVLISVDSLCCRCLLNAASRHYAHQPPVYTPPAANYYQAPPPAYAPPTGPTYAFVPHQTFPTAPPRKHRRCSVNSFSFSLYDVVLV